MVKVKAHTLFKVIRLDWTARRHVSDCELVSILDLDFITMTPVRTLNVTIQAADFVCDRHSLRWLRQVLPNIKLVASCVEPAALCLFFDKLVEVPFAASIVRWLASHHCLCLTHREAVT